MLSPLETAIQLAVRAHTGQMDEDGMPHVVHCFEVMLRVKKWCEENVNSAASALKLYTLEELLIAAILHDTVEDSWTNPTALERVDLDRIEAMFGKNVRTLVDGLTRRGLEDHDTKETYRDFIYRAKQDPGTAFIKSADLEHNRSRAWQIKSASWRDKLEFKYGVALRVLSSDHPTWEQASWTWTVSKGHSVADPNGKRIFLSEEEFQALKATWA